MNIRRQEMEAKLPPPSQLLCSHLWRTLNEAGLRISQEDIVFLSRVFCDYIQNTPEGKKTALKLLNASIKPADPRNSYYPNQQNQAAKEIPAKELQYFAGWIYKGAMGVGAEHIEVEKNGGLEACEATGIMGPREYCVKVVKEQGKNGDRLVSLSNYARLMSENASIRDSASQKVCEVCPVDSCDYHPRREPKQLTLSIGENNGIANNPRDHFF